MTQTDQDYETTLEQTVDAMRTDMAMLNTRILQQTEQLERQAKLLKANDHYITELQESEVIQLLHQLVQEHNMRIQQQNEDLQKQGKLLNEAVEAISALNDTVDLHGRHLVQYRAYIKTLREKMLTVEGQLLTNFLTTTGKSVEEVQKQVKEFVEKEGGGTVEFKLHNVTSRSLINL